MSPYERAQHQRYKRDAPTAGRDSGPPHDTGNYHDRTRRGRDYSYKKGPKVAQSQRPHTFTSHYDEYKSGRRVPHHTSYVTNSYSESSYTYSDTDERDDQSSVGPDRSLQNTWELKTLCKQIAQYVAEACAQSARMSHSLCVENASSILSPSLEEGLDDPIPMGTRHPTLPRRLHVTNGELSKSSRMVRSNDKLQPISEVFNNGHSASGSVRDRDGSHSISRSHQTQHGSAASSMVASKRGASQLESSPLRTRYGISRSPVTRPLVEESLNSPRELYSNAAKKPIREKIVNVVPNNGAFVDNLLTDEMSLRQPVIAAPIQKPRKHISSATRQDGHDIHRDNVYLNETSDIKTRASGKSSSLASSTSSSSSYSDEDDYAETVSITRPGTFTTHALDSNQVLSSMTADMGVHPAKDNEKRHLRKAGLSETKALSSNLKSDESLKSINALSDGLRNTDGGGGGHNKRSREVGRLISSLAESSLYAGLYAVNFNKQAIAMKLVELSTDFMRLRSEVTTEVTELRSIVSSLSAQVKAFERTLNGLQMTVHTQPNFVRGSGIFWNDGLNHKDSLTTQAAGSCPHAPNGAVQTNYPKVVSTPVTDNDGTSRSSAQVATRSPDPVDHGKFDEKPPIAPSTNLITTDALSKSEYRIHNNMTDGYSGSAQDSASSQAETNSLSIVQMGDGRHSTVTGGTADRDNKYQQQIPPASERSASASTSASGVKIPQLNFNQDSINRRNFSEAPITQSARKNGHISIQDFIEPPTREKSPGKRQPLMQNSLASCGDEPEGQGGFGDTPGSAMSTDDPDRPIEAKSGSRRSHKGGNAELSDRREFPDQTSHTSACHEASDAQRHHESKQRQRKQRKERGHQSSAKDGGVQSQSQSQSQAQIQVNHIQQQGQGIDETSYSYSLLSEKTGTGVQEGGAQPELKIGISTGDLPAHPYLLLHPELATRVAQLDPSKYGLTERLFVSDLSRSSSIFTEDTEFMIAETTNVLKSIYLLPSLQNNNLATWPMACKTLGNLMLNTDGPFWKATYQCARYLLVLYTAYGSVVLDAGLYEIYQRFCVALQTMKGDGNEEIQADCWLVASLLDLICGISQLRQNGDLVRVMSAIVSIGSNLAHINLSAQVFPLPVCLAIAMEEMIVEESFQSINTWIALDREPEGEEEKRIVEFAICFSTNFYTVINYVTSFYNAIVAHSVESGESFSLDNPLTAGTLCNLVSQYYVGMLLQKNLMPPKDTQEAASLQAGLEQMLQTVPQIYYILNEDNRATGGA